MNGTGIRAGSAPALLGVAALLAGCGASEVAVPVDPTASSPTVSVSPIDPQGTASTGPSASASAGSAVAGQPTVGSPAKLVVALTRTSPEGVRDVAVTADVQGVVPQLVDGAGTPLAGDQTEVMGTHVVWGDGAQDGSDPGDVQCTKSGARVRMTETFPLTHTYAKPGRYTVTFTAGACPPLHDVTKRLVVVVR